VPTPCQDRVHLARGSPEAGTRCGERWSSWGQPNVHRQQAPLLPGVHGHGRVRLGGQLCVLRQEQDRTKATHGDAQVAPGDGPLREDPFSSLSMDLLGPLPQTKTGNVFLLIIVDRFSKLVRAVSLAGITATDVSSALCRDWIFVYGPPDTVLTDNGP